MGGPSQATKDQQGVTLEASKQQLAFNEQLMTLFQSQFANQKSILDFLTGTLKPIIARSEAGKGYSTEEEAALRTSATDTLSQEFKGAQQALNQELKTAGDANVPSGVTVGADTALLNSEAIVKAGAQRDITTNSAEVARSNLWNAVNALSGNAAQQNPLGYAGAATGGSGAIAGLGESQSALQNSLTNAYSNSFFGKFANSFATGLGGSLAGAVTGGAGMAIPFANPF